MTLNFHDPIFLISLALVVVGLFAFLWSVAKFFGKKNATDSDAEEMDPIDDDLPYKLDDTPLPTSFSSTPHEAPLVKEEPRRGVPAASASPVLSKDVLDKLDTMASRLSEMQTVLTRQTPGAPNSVGQGFSADTIDKLLKIIGNVTQQVDVLQRSLGGKPAEPTKPVAGGAPATQPAAKPATPPPSAPPVAGVTGVGVKPPDLAPAATPKPVAGANPIPPPSAAPPNPQKPIALPGISNKPVSPGEAPKATPTTPPSPPKS